MSEYSVLYPQAEFVPDCPMCRRPEPFLVCAAEAWENHVSKAVGAVEFGLTLCPFNGALQPATQKTLQNGKRTTQQEDNSR